MDLHRTLRAWRQRWWIVPLTVTAALLAAGLVTVRTTPRYAATVTFFVTGPERNPDDAPPGGLLHRQRLTSYADLLTSDRLSRRVAEQSATGLTAGQVQRRLAARSNPDTVLLTATVTDADRARALRLAEVLSAQFATLVAEIETAPGADRPAVRVDVVRGPRAEPDPVTPRPARDLTLAGLLGLLLGLGLALLRALTDRTIRDGATLARLASAPLLGEIPFDATARTNPLMVGEAARSPRAEAIRKLRTNLRFVDAEEPARVIGVTSPVQGEGKTTLACNLAIALAEAGWQVLLVDADLRRSRLSRYLRLDPGPGLTDVLIGDLDPEDAVQPWGDLPLLVLPAGSVPVNPSELLGSRSMAELLLHLRGMADIVVVDTAPLLAVADGVVAAVQTDGVLLVTRYGRTSRARARAAVAALRGVDARLLGCVLNLAKITRAEARRYLAYQVELPAGFGGADVPGGGGSAGGATADAAATGGEAAGGDAGDGTREAAAPAPEELSRAPR